MAQTLFSGFCQYPALVINGSTSPIGEINTLGESYAGRRDADRYYNGKGISELAIHRGVAGESFLEKIPASHVTPVMNLLDWMFDQANTNKFNGNMQATLQALIAEFSPAAVFDKIGNMETDGRVWLPSYISFSYTVGVVVHDFKIWFAIQNFIDEYPYRDVYVFGPVPPAEIDLLVEYNYQELAKRFAEETYSRLQTRIDALLDDNKYPVSKRLVVKFDIYDLINKPYKTVGEWTVVVYGNPKNADDQINEAIKDCILSNSKYREADFEPRIPDLFNPLELFVVPHFNELGLDNETAKGSTYSPVLTYQNGDTLANRYADFYDADFIAASLQVVPHLWKSIKMSIVGKPNNNQGKTTFLSLYPDYQLIPSIDRQAGMMDDATWDFVAGMESILAAAEIANDSNNLPDGINKVTRKNRLYVTSNVGKVKLTVATRYQFVKDGLIDE